LVSLANLAALLEVADTSSAASGGGCTARDKALIRGRCTPGAFTSPFSACCRNHQLSPGRAPLWEVGRDSNGMLHAVQGSFLESVRLLLSAALSPGEGEEATGAWIPLKERRAR